MVGLLPREAPLFVGFQEIGGGEDLAAPAHSATARYGHNYQALFARGKDTSTGQNVGAIQDTSSGWGVYGQASRVSDLERELSKHMVMRLANAVTSMDICVVHLRRPIGSGGVEKQRNQCRALLCAPTGRAARRLSETTGVEAKTIHRLLEDNPASGGFNAEAEETRRQDKRLLSTYCPKSVQAGRPPCRWSSCLCGP